MSASPNTRLTRDKSEGMLGGVCAGIAARYGYDVNLVRLIWVVATVLTSGAGILVYLVAWVLLPSAGAVASPSIGERRREFSGEVTAAAERAAEAARIAATHARQAADEIAAVARGMNSTAAAPVEAAPPPAPPAEQSVDPAAPTPLNPTPPEVDPPAAGPAQP